MPTYTDLGSSYLILNDDGTTNEIPKSLISPEQEARLTGGMPSTPQFGASINVPNAGPTLGPLPVGQPKYGEAPNIEAVKQKVAALPSMGGLPASPDLVKIREQAKQETAIPAPSAELGGGPGKPPDEDILRQQIRAKDFEMQQAQDRRAELLKAQEAKIEKSKQDLQNYDVSPEHFWSGRKVARTQEEREAEVLNKARTETRPIGKFQSLEDYASKGKGIGQGVGISDAELQRRVEEQTEPTKTVGGQPGWAKAAMVIGAALLAQAAARRGGDMTAGIKVINQAVDRDLEAQQVELNKRKGALGEEVNYLGEMKNTFKSEDAANLMAKNGLLESLKSELDRQEKRVNDVQGQAQIQNVRKGVELQQRQLQQGALQLEGTLAAKEDELAYGRQALAAEKRQRMMDERSVPGTVFSGEKTPTQKDADNVNKARAAAMGATRSIDFLLNHIFGPEGVGAELTSMSTDAKLAMQRSSDVITAMIEMKKRGANFSANEEKLIYDAFTRNPTGWRNLITDQNKVLMEQAKDILQKAYMDVARQGGYREREMGTPSGFQSAQ